MPPKVKIDKNKIIEAALKIIREEGLNNLNARKIAKKLKCSTQPIFSNYKNMNELKDEISKECVNIFNNYLKKGISDNNYPKYKATGMYYIKFAMEEKEIFKLLFMTDYKNPFQNDSIDYIYEIISESLKISIEEAKSFHINMWIFVHGIATMEVTSNYKWSLEDISKMLTEMYLGLVTYYKNRNMNNKNNY